MKITKMPTKELLEEYLNGGHDDYPVTVYFNISKGIFERHNNDTVSRDTKLERPLVTENN